MEDVMNDLLVPASDTDDDFDEEDGDETMEVNLLSLPNLKLTICRFLNSL